MTIPKLGLNKNIEDIYLKGLLALLSSKLSFRYWPYVSIKRIQNCSLSRREFILPSDTDFSGMFIDMCYQALP